MSHIIQHLLFPNLSIQAPVDLYFRCGDGVHTPLNNRHSEWVRPSLEERKLFFLKHGRISTDTFYNGLSVSVWKENSPIKEVALALKGNGKFVLRFGHHQIGADMGYPIGHRLSETTIFLSQNTETKITLPFWSELNEGIVCFELQALEDGATLEEGWYETDLAPINDVKLGIVITHFNRKQWVLPAIERMRQGLFNNTCYNEKIKLIVVDNSKNITHEEARGCTLLPNQNLGGAGGFTRGLLYVKDEGTFTHCMFMDDDASCELESIKRTYHILQYASKPKTAVAGSLLREDLPFSLIEKGAVFNGMCHPLHHGLDMRYVFDLILCENQQLSQRPNYGGWWFFGFKITDATHFPFPFFVRGDDSLFSLMNQFHIVTSNGIACFAEDFGHKHGPLTCYLDTRYHALHNTAVLGLSFKATSKNLKKLFMNTLFSYNYASAEAIRQGVEDFMKGADFWKENLDMSKIRPALSLLSAEEKMISTAGHEGLLQTAKARLWAVHQKKKKGLLTRLSERLWNGFLLPSFLLKNTPILQYKSFHANSKEVYGAKTIVYLHEKTQTFRIATHNKNLFFRRWWDFYLTLKKLEKNYDSLRTEYQQKVIPELATEAFWRSVYAEELKTN